MMEEGRERRNEGMSLAGNKRKQVFFRIKKIEGDDVWLNRVKQLMMARKLREKREERQVQT